MNKDKKALEINIGDTCEFISGNSSFSGASITGKVKEIKKGLFGKKYLMEYRIIHAGWSDIPQKYTEYVRLSDIREVKHKEA